MNLTQATMRHLPTCRRFLAAPICAVAVLGLLSVTMGTVYADNARSVRFQHLDRNDGLSQSFVYSIVQDRQGFMWFGTQEGLNRYDGFDFTVFTHDPDDPLSISDESIRTIIEDSRGILWTGTDAGGLSRYDATRQTFTNYLHDPSSPASIADNRVRVLYEDSQAQLWVGTDGSGLDRFDPETGDFEHFPSEPSAPGSLAGAHVWSILEDSDGTLWVATEQGLSRFDASDRSFTNFTHDPADESSISDNQLRVLYEDSDQNLWIGTESGGLNRLDRATGSFERFIHDAADPGSISANRINALFQDDAGVLWIGTVKGLNAWNPARRNFEHYSHSQSDRYSLGHDTVLSIFQDRGNVLWVGTYSGLSLWNQATRAMLHYKRNVEDPHSLSADAVTSFAEDASGTIWIGTFGGGLDAFDPATDRFRHTRHEPQDDLSISSDRVMALHVDSSDALWAGTRDAGLNRYDAQSGRFVRYRHDAQDPTSLSADGVTYILEDSKQGLWIATFGGGLNYLEPGTQEFRRYRNDPDDPTTLSSDRVLILFEDAAKNLWIGTYGGGLNRFDPSSNSFARFTAQADEPDSLSGNEIYVIQEDANGDLWVGTKGAGLNRWRREDREAGNASFQRFTEIDGLPSATLYSGIWDDAGHLWLSTSRGLSRLNTSTMEFRNFDSSHGLQGDEFNLAAGFRTSSGRLFFGGMNGFNAFRPDQLVINAAPPQVAITELRELNRPIDLGESRSNGLPVELNYRQDVISIEFAALDFAAPGKNRFMYRLEGLDKDWNDIGTKREVTFANLPSGNYRLRVKAANNDGVWSEQEATLDIRMNPAPWKTWWAYAGYTLALAVLAVIGFRSHARRARYAATAKYAEELSLAKGRLTDAQRIARIGNWEWSVADNVLWWSDEIYRIFQMEKGQTRLSFDAYLQRVHPDDRQLVTDALDRALKNRKPYSVDVRILQNDGTVRFVHEQAEVMFDAEGQPLKMAGTVHDITERKQAENDLRHRAEFQALLARLSSELIRAHPGDIALQISETLELVGMTYELDAINVRWHNNGDKELPTIHRWTSRPGGKHPERLRRTAYPWTCEKMLAGEPIVVQDVRELPEPAAVDKASYRRRGVGSFVIIPLLIDNTLVGSIAFSMFDEKRSWPLTQVNEFRLIAEILAGAIARSRGVAKIEQLTSRLQEENFYLRQEVSLAHRFDEIVGEDKTLMKCLQLVEKVAPTDVAVLVLGETGTGKELLARAIHKLSPRCNAPMISVNCPALPTNLIESELFGHEKGAFTGAESRRIGRFELAEGGTLFLDEIGELPLEVQSKLLRVLQTGEFDRLGSTKTLQANVRLIAATNRDLQRAVSKGEFRADLFYRISSFPITLPALRERSSDIPLLAEHFVRKHAARLNKKINAISAGMINEIVSYEWPGNIRELESVIERALISANDNSVLELPAPLRLIGVLRQSKTDFAINDDAELSSIERAHIMEVLRKTNWKVSGADGAASLLGIPSSTLRSKMKRLGIHR